MVVAQWPLRKDAMPPEVYLPQKLRKNLDFWFPKTAPTRLPDQKQEVFNPKGRFVVCVRCFGARRRRFSHPPGPGELLHSEDAICQREVGGYYPLDVDLRISKNLRPIVAVPDEDGVL